MLFLVDFPRTLPLIPYTITECGITIDFKVCIRTEAAAEADANGMKWASDELKLSFRIRDAATRETIFETTTSFAPDQASEWTSVSIRIPVVALAREITRIVQIDCLEDLPWRTPPSFSCELAGHAIKPVLAERSSALGASQFLQETSRQWREAEFGPVAGVVAHPDDIVRHHRAILSLVFRMKPEIISLPGAEFRRHCYLTVLKREPEEGATERGKLLILKEEKISSWRKFFQSEEFRSQKLKFEGDVDRRMVASLGWSRDNTLLTYALRFEKLRFPDDQSFFDMMATCLLANTYSEADLESALECKDVQLRYFFDAAVSLAAEYVAGMDRLSALEDAVQQLLSDPRRSTAAGDQRTPRDRIGEYAPESNPTVRTTLQDKPSGLSLAKVNFFANS